MGSPGPPELCGQRVQPAAEKVQVANRLPPRPQDATNKPANVPGEVLGASGGDMIRAANGESDGSRGQTWPGGNP